MLAQTKVHALLYGTGTYALPPLKPKKASLKIKY
jgi:hypothetical protein